MSFNKKNKPENKSTNNNTALNTLQSQPILFGFQFSANFYLWKIFSWMFNVFSTQRAKNLSSKSRISLLNLKKSVF